MRRTEEQANILKALDGIHQVGEEFDKTIDEIHGMYDSPARSLSRIPGKKLTTTGTGLDPIWSLHTLRFRDGVTILQREGANLRAWSSPPPVQGVRFPAISFGDGSDSPDRNNPPYPDPGGFPAPGRGKYPNLPTPEEVKDATDAGERTLPSPTDPFLYDISILAVPSSVTLRTITEVLSRSFDIITIGAAGSQVNYLEVRADWAEGWLGVSYESAPGIEVGLAQGGTAPFRSASGFESENIQMKANGNPAGLPDGVYSDIVTFTLIYSRDGRPYRNSTGGLVTTTLGVNFYVGNPDLLIVTPSPIVFDTQEDL